jgi:hypothetical protein
MNKQYEVGEIVTINEINYMNAAKGIILDTSSSSDPANTMYTVDVEDYGTHFFYGNSLDSTERTEGNVHELST